ncbi:DEAD/DEAH box helicase [Methylobacterium platani]|uniref:DEAD-box ATP-dependent RNA helicase RhpA n=2 Tax=Methylobacterium platani TaxID=427683 RepID=A0A179SJD3_9HYPH|nr:DEAD/DEAH box helicase [Methylobacterium platani]KMO21563.1 RNA helicase [Methylobacterium platani JCM 14648]OAS26664.1 RNA helicase [Methylobacterium platani]
MTQFTDFGLAAPILKALAQAGYVTPTPIQAQAIPPAMQGKDLCGIAQTGTGKTASFALPILHRLAGDAAKPAPRRSCRVLVLAPTRELASQIADSFKEYGQFLKLTTTVVFGGVTIGRQERALAGGVDVLVATPGRLLDLIDRRSLTLDGVEYLVLDEADQMLDLGFIHALKRIVKLLPAQRQSLFFSATMPKNIAGLADQYLKNPVQVAVTPVATTAERVDQKVVFVPTGSKQSLLATILRDESIDRVLVFTRTKHGADRVVRGLERDGIGSAAIHGNKSQPQRERALAAFRAGTCRVLVATDIAARGIDVDGVSHVVNFDLPNVPEAYVHRIGRTARAGKDGLAISFCNDEERAYLRDIERLTRQKVPLMAIPEGFVPPSREEAAQAVAEAERDRRQPGSGPRGQRPGGGRQGQQPGGRQGQPRHGAGRPQEHREPRADGRGGHEGRQARPQGQGQGRPQGQGQGRPQGGQRADGNRQQRPAGGGANRDGRAIGWLDRAPR